MTIRPVINLAFLCGFAFAGGMFSQYWFGNFVASSEARESRPEYSIMEPQSYRDQEGRLRLKIGIEDGQPQEALLGEDGKFRVWLGTESKDGREVPSIRLIDNQGRLKFVLRLTGNNQSPMLEMKDSRNQDRIVMGLAPDDASEEPFLTYFDNRGEKHAVFGDY